MPLALPFLAFPKAGDSQGVMAPWETRPVLGWGKAVGSSGVPFRGTPCLHTPLPTPARVGSPSGTHDLVGACSRPLSAPCPTGSPCTRDPGPEGVYNEITQPVTHSGYLYRATAPPKLPGARKSKEGECGQRGRAASVVPTPMPLTPHPRRLPAHVVLPGESPALLRDREMH